MIEAYPLSWPAEYPRTTRKKNSQFKTSLARARDFVKDEIRRLGGKQPVISTNVPLKNDGDLRADWSRYKLDDTGAAVYFMHNDKQVCLCCDTYVRVHENLHAIGRTIEALRQIDRDGVSDFLNRAFTGFVAIPETSSFNQKSIWEILGLPVIPAEESDIHVAFKRQSKKVHPDAGGTEAAFHELQEAYKQALNFYKR
jgi:hypothetical protein